MRVISNNSDLGFRCSKLSLTFQSPSVPQDYDPTTCHGALRLEEGKARFTDGLLETTELSWILDQTVVRVSTQSTIRNSLSLRLMKVECACLARVVLGGFLYRYFERPLSEVSAMSSQREWLCRPAVHVSARPIRNGSARLPETRPRVTLQRLDLRHSRTRCNRAIWTLLLPSQRQKVCATQCAWRARLCVPR